jgi:hypothetical protein
LAVSLDFLVGDEDLKVVDKKNATVGRYREAAARRQGSYFLCPRQPY